MSSRVSVFTSICPLMRSSIFTTVFSGILNLMVQPVVSLTSLSLSSLLRDRELRRLILLFCPYMKVCPAASASALLASSSSAESKA